MRNQPNKQTDVSGFSRHRNPYLRASGRRVWLRRAPRLQFSRGGVCRPPPPPCCTSKEERRCGRTATEQSSVFRIIQNEVERDKHQVWRRETYFHNSAPKSRAAIHSLLLVSVLSLVRKRILWVKSNLVGIITAIGAPPTCLSFSIT